MLPTYFYESLQTKWLRCMICLIGKEEVTDAYVQTY